MNIDPNSRDVAMIAVAETGGAICVNYLGGFLNEEGNATPAAPLWPSSWTNTGGTSPLASVQRLESIWDDRARSSTGRSGLTRLEQTRRT